MTLVKFIKANKKKIDEAILRVCPNCQLNDSERKPMDSKRRRALQLGKKRRCKIAIALS